MDIIIVGCGRLGSSLAYRLCKQGHDLGIVDNDPQAFNNLPPDFLGRTYDGNALNQEVMLRAGISTAGVLAAVTNQDVSNLVIGRIALEVYHVPNVIARNFDPKLLSLYETFGLTTVSSTRWGTQRIEAMILHKDLDVEYSAANGEVEIYKIAVPKDLKGRKLMDFISKQDMVVIAVTSAGKTISPKPDTILEAGDILYIGSTLTNMHDLIKMLGINQEEA